MAELRYIARIPWIPPGAGQPYPQNPPRLRSVMAGTDPGLGKALFAVFIPVVRSNGKLEPADSNGKPSTVADAGWAQDFTSNIQGMFRIEARAEWWDRVSGVVLALIYDQSGLDDPTFPRTFKEQLAAEGQLAAANVAAASTAQPRSVSQLPPDMRDEVQRQVQQLLGSNSADLNTAVIPPPR
jgi:hypothetical protein